MHWDAVKDRRGHMWEVVRDRRPCIGMRSTIALGAHLGGGPGAPAVHRDAVNDRMGAHLGGGPGAPAVHWDAVNDRRRCIEMCLALVYLCSQFCQAVDTSSVF